MTLSDTDKALLRQTAKSTPMGELLRQYWYPVATVADLTPETPAKRVRILSERLVLFRDTSGRAALIPERCPHEGASMLVGAVNDHGITCVLHGWFFDTERMCSVWYDDTVWAEGYPAREHAGLYWAYLGPEPAPALPADGVLGEPGRRRRITVYPPMAGNWLLESRSGLDPWRFHERLTGAPGMGAPLVAPSGEFSQAEDGIAKHVARADGGDDTQPFVLSAHLHAGPLWLLTPVDQEQTLVISIESLPLAGGAHDGLDAEIVVVPAGEQLPEMDLSQPHSFFTPWGSEPVGGSGTEMICRLLLEKLAAADVSRT